MNVHLFKLINLILKVIVFGGDMLMTLHCLLLLNGKDEWVAEYIGGFSMGGFIALFLASFLLRFCWLYRSCLLHDFLVYSCIVMHQRIELDFGIWLTPLRYIMLAWGFLNILWLIKVEIINVTNHKERKTDSTLTKRSC